MKPTDELLSPRLRGADQRCLCVFLDREGFSAAFPLGFSWNKPSWGWEFSHMGLAEGASGNRRVGQQIEQLISPRGA